MVLVLTTLTVAAAPGAIVSTRAPGRGPVTYYVDGANGDDAASGRDPQHAWRSLDAGSRAVLAPGDRLLLRRGRVWTGELDIRGSGSRSRPIVVGAYGNGARPVVQRGATCIAINGTNIVVKDLAVDGCAWAGVSVSGPSNTVTRMRISHNAVGVYVRPAASATTISFNQIVDNKTMSVLTRTPTNDDSGAFGILLRGDRNKVLFNTISGSDAFSYDYGRDGSAVEIFGGRDNVVAYNIAIDNRAFSELGGARSFDNVYAYDLVRSSLPFSTFLITRGAGSPLGPVGRTQVFNVTAYLSGRNSEGVVCEAGCGATILTLRNTILAINGRAGFADAPFDDRDNVLSSASRFFDGPGTIVADAEFVDPAGGNFALAPTSPAIDRGTELAPGFTHDLAGAPVPVDGNGDGVAAPDAGAYEYEPGR
jgi:hypothetical protein